MTSLEGHLLAASPSLPDSNFSKTVVLLIQHDEQGAFGVVLNRDSHRTLEAVWGAVTEEPCRHDMPLQVGGPVEGPLMALHTRADLSEREVLPGVYFAAQREALEQLVGAGGHPLRIYSGYSGWGSGQLETELEAGSWFTVAAKAEHIFYDGDDLWQDLADDVGHKAVFSQLKIKHVPTDPTLN